MDSDSDNGATGSPTQPVWALFSGQLREESYLLIDEARRGCAASAHSRYQRAPIIIHERLDALGKWVILLIDAKGGVW